MRGFVSVLAGGLLFACLATPAVAKELWEGQPPHGRNLMTKAERREFWREFLALETDDERRAYWLDHNAKMDRRALDWGVSLEPARTELGGNLNLGFWRPPYFSDIMTEEEVASYRSDLDALPDREDRRRYVREHIVRMQVRAARRGVSIPSALEFDDVFDGTTADEAGAAAIRAELGYDAGVVPADVSESAEDDEAFDSDEPSLDAGEDERQDADDGDSLDSGENPGDGDL